MKYLGDFIEDATVYFAFTTNAADGGRESLSASLEEADITIYKNGSAMTLDASTITVTANPGSQVGVYLVSVDMSNDADFSTAADYIAVLYPSDEQVDSQDVAGVLAHWSCQNRTVDVRAISGDSTAADNLEADYDGTGYNKSNSTIGTCTTNTDMRGTDSANTTTPPTAAAIRSEIDSNSTQLAAIVADTNELQTDWADGGRLDLILDELTTQCDTNEGKIDTIDTVVDAILVDTGTTLPATLSTIDSNVDAILVDTGTTLPAAIPSAATIADAVWDELLSGHTSDGSFGYIIGTSLPAAITNVAAILVDTGTTLPATLSGMETKIDTIDTEVDKIPRSDAALAAGGTFNYNKVSETSSDIQLVISTV